MPYPCTTDCRPWQAGGGTPWPPVVSRGSTPPRHGQPMPSASRYAARAASTMTAATPPSARRPPSAACLSLTWRRRAPARLDGGRRGPHECLRDSDDSSADRHGRITVRDVAAGHPFADPSTELGVVPARDEPVSETIGWVALLRNGHGRCSLRTVWDMRMLQCRLLPAFA